MHQYKAKVQWFKELIFMKQLFHPRADPNFLLFANRVMSKYYLFQSHETPLANFIIENDPLKLTMGMVSRPFSILVWVERGSPDIWSLLFDGLGFQSRDFGDLRVWFSIFEILVKCIYHRFLTGIYGDRYLRFSVSTSCRSGFSMYERLYSSMITLKLGWPGFGEIHSHWTGLGKIWPEHC